MVRLYVAWPGVEPAEAVYNNTYLDVSVLIASKYTNFSVFLRKMSIIYGQNTEEANAHKAVAGIVTSSGL